MPSVSRQQQKAMFAAKSGNSTLGIPQSVGSDFAKADIARGKKKLPARVKDGVALGDSFANKRDADTDFR